MKNSILKKLQIYILCFGVTMGFIFPVYANFFVIWKEGMFLYFLAGCILAGITVGVVSFALVKLILLKPLLIVSDVANGIEMKDLSGEITIQSNDSVGDIINGINAAIKNLKRFIFEIKNISNLIEDIVNKNGQETSTIANIANIEGSIEIVNQATTHISDLSENIKEVVIHGNQNIALLQQKINETNRDSEDLIQIISSMATNSKNIQNVMELINNIADKTDILSINASIESVRAGENGKSFAIVAQEVRKLAKNVSDSSHKINQTVNILEIDIKRALQITHTIHEHIVENKEESNELKRKFAIIENITETNQQANVELVKAVKTLNTSFNTIQNAFGDLSKNANDLQLIVNTYQH